LLAFWLKPTVYVLFCVTFGAPDALATPDGGAELPGSAAPTSGQFALEEAPPAAVADVVELVVPVEQAASMVVARAAVPSTPRDVVIFKAVSSGSTPAALATGASSVLPPMPGL